MAVSKYQLRVFQEECSAPVCHTLVSRATGIGCFIVLMCSKPHHIGAVTAQLQYAEKMRKMILKHCWLHDGRVSTRVKYLT